MDIAVMIANEQYCNCKACQFRRENYEMQVTEFEWCKDNAETDKEFLGWLYCRLQNAMGDRYTMPHMSRLQNIIRRMPGKIPDAPLEVKIKRLGLDIGVIDILDREGLKIVEK